jgi:hypothetical protein
MNSESLFHSLFQTARGAGIDPLQLAMDLVQRASGVGVVHHGVGGQQAIPLARTVLTRQLEELRELRMLDGETLTEQVRQLIVTGGVELENRR